MGNLKKHYIGSIQSEQKAARIYDHHAILTHGLKAKTNFSYNKKEIIRILERESDDVCYEDTFVSSTASQNENNLD